MESVTSVRFYAESFEVGVNETKGNGCVDNTVEVFHAERFFKRKAANSSLPHALKLKKALYSQYPLDRESLCHLLKYNSCTCTYTSLVPTPGTRQAVGRGSGGNILRGWGSYRVGSEAL